MSEHGSQTSAPVDIKFSCPHCNQHLEAPHSMGGNVTTCPSCGRAIRVPSSADSLAPTRRKLRAVPLDGATNPQQRLNTPQRMTIAAVTPLILVVAGYGVINTLIDDYYSPLGSFHHTWWMWGIVLFIVGGFEFYWFRDRDTSVTTGEGRANTYARPKNPTSPHPVTVTVCSLIGWACIVTSSLALYSGGEGGRLRILRLLLHGDIVGAFCFLLGASIPTIIALVMGLIIHKHGAGVILMVAASLYLGATFLTF